MNPAAHSAAMVTQRQSSDMPPRAAAFFGEAVCPGFISGKKADGMVSTKSS